MREIRRDKRAFAAAVALLVFFFGFPAFADEFDVFDTAPTQRARAEVALDAEVAFVYRYENTEQGADPAVVSGFLEPGIRFDLAPNLSFAATGGVSFEGGIAPTASPTVEIGIPDAVLSASFGDVIFLKTGIIGMSAGSDPIFNPTSWFARYSENPNRPGGKSFLGIGASAYAGIVKIGLSFLPEIGFPSYDIFAKPSSGSAMEARVSASMLGGSTAALGFIQTEAGSLKPRFAGAGFEVQIPVSKSMSVRAEGMLSNGLNAWGTENGFLVPISGSEATPFFEGFAAVSATVFSVLDVGAGYMYSGRGLDAKGTMAVARGADALLRHRLYVTLGIPKITDRAGVILFVFASPQDGSVKFLFDLFAQAAEMSDLHIRLELNPSPISASISAIAAFSARERL